MTSWLLWAAAAVALAIGEVLTPGLFVLGPIALAAGVVAALAALGAGPEVQLAVFAAASAASVFVLRPVARRHVRLPAPLRTGTAALTGAEAVVLERVDAEGGRVKLSGELWSARAFFPDQVIEPGQRVEVVRIEGATALVHE